MKKFSLPYEYKEIAKTFGFTWDSSRKMWLAESPKFNKYVVLNKITDECYQVLVEHPDSKKLIVIFCGPFEKRSVAKNLDFTWDNELKVWWREYKAGNYTTSDLIEFENA